MRKTNSLEEKKERVSPNHEKKNPPPRKPTQWEDRRKKTTPSPYQKLRLHKTKRGGGGRGKDRRKKPCPTVEKMAPLQSARFGGPAKGDIEPRRGPEGEKNTTRLSNHPKGLGV